ncbi:Uncharacterised protein [Mycobacteroides abscessus subsp. abscessus]|nr:hypothetical protein [Mycobacteroides abscessus]SIN50294.1 Uncharacterised protein [Mycobacteroides abscessus subsp. abscessus]SKH64773.1 Uncharacterised protein [Mycobacteroides abscessus subsp. abscessus]
MSTSTAAPAITAGSRQPMLSGSRVWSRGVGEVTDTSLIRAARGELAYSWGECEK